MADTWRDQTEYLIGSAILFLALGMIEIRMNLKGGTKSALWLAFIGTTVSILGAVHLVPSGHYVGVICIGIISKMALDSVDGVP